MECASDNINEINYEDDIFAENEGEHVTLVDLCVELDLYFTSDKLIRNVHSTCPSSSQLRAMSCVRMTPRV